MQSVAEVCPAGKPIWAFVDEVQAIMRHRTADKQWERRLGEDRYDDAELEDGRLVKHVLHRTYVSKLAE